MKKEYEEDGATSDAKEEQQLEGCENEVQELEGQEAEENSITWREKVLLLVAAVVVVVIVVGLVGVCCWSGHQARILSNMEGSFGFDSTTTRLKEFYPTTTVRWKSGSDVISGTVGNDGEFMRYCFYQYPYACHESAPWTTSEDFIKLFRADYDSWAYLDAKAKDAYILWANDDIHGWHCYMLVPDYPYTSSFYGSHNLVSGWFYQDGVRITAYDDESRISSMKPSDLVAEYQANGCFSRGGLRSADFSTVVNFTSSGQLYYKYEAEYYDKMTDIQGIAYQGYELPWWEEATSEELQHITSWNSDEVIGGRIWRSRISVDCYPDLPIDYQPTIYDSARYEMCELADKSSQCGTFFLTPEGIIMASRGEIIERWDFTADTVIEDESSCRVYEQMTCSSDDYLVVVYMNDQLIGFKHGGAIEVIFDEVVGRKPDYLSNSIFGLRGNQLMHWGRGKITLISDDVIDVSDEMRCLFAKEDGCYAVNAVGRYSSSSFEDGFEVIYLGDESLEYYIWVYETISDSDLYYR